MRETYESNPIFKSNRRKILLFFLLISTSVSVIFSVGCRDLHVTFLDTLKNFPLFFVGLILSPFFNLLFIRKKGIYSACILLIFLTELSLMCSVFYGENTFLEAVGNLALGVLLPGIFITAALLTFYLLGPIDYIFNVLKTFIFILGGFFMYFPLQETAQTPASLQSLIIITYGILAISFFIVFSAWNHRLVLLK